MFYQKNTCVGKAATMKRFEYSPLCKKLKAQPDFEKKQYEALDKIDETINKKPTLKNYGKSNLKYDGNYGFCKYGDIKKFDKSSLKSKHSFLANFFYDLDKFTKLKTQKEKKCIIKLQNYIMTC